VNRSEIENKVREFAAAAASESGFELVHVEFTGTGKQAAVRVFIDKVGGITHDDCSQMSHALERHMEPAELINGRYILEVSSPGIERGLYGLKDFERFSGESAKIKTVSAINGQKNFRGTVLGVSAGDVKFEDRTSGKVSIPWDLISKANLEFDIERELKESKKKNKS
jgi:ribosome maturation factor RimP